MSRTGARSSTSAPARPRPNRCVASTPMTGAEAPAPRRGLMLVVSSPSGAGKTTLTRRLIAAHPELALSISYTTRSPRPGELDGREYVFVDAERFAEMARRRGFLEHAVDGYLLHTHIVRARALTIIVSVNAGAAG